MNSETKNGSRYRRHQRCWPTWSFLTAAWACRWERWSPDGTKRYYLLFFLDKERKKKRKKKLIGSEKKKGPVLHYVDSDGQRLKNDLFSVGSGSTHAYGVLDGEYHYDMTEAEAIDLGRRAIYHATFRDAFSGGSVRGIFTLSMLYYSHARMLRYSLQKKK